MMKLHAQDVYICILCWFVQFDEKWCCGGWMMVISWLYDVDVVVWWCSHQFMLWVLMKVLLWLNYGDFATFVKMGW